jgi:hypothetical protein
MQELKPTKQDKEECLKLLAERFGSSDFKPYSIWNRYTRSILNDFCRNWKLEYEEIDDDIRETYKTTITNKKNPSISFEGKIGLPIMKSKMFDLEYFLDSFSVIEADDVDWDISEAEEKKLSEQNNRFYEAVGMDAYVDLFGGSV